MTFEFIFLCKRIESTDNIFSYNTLLTVIITIIIFFLGVLFQKRLERFKHKIYLKSIKNNFLDLIKILPVSYIDPQIAQLRFFYLNTNIDTGVRIIPPMTISGNLNRLSEFSSNDLFSAFRTTKKDGFEKDLHEILSHIDYLTEQKNIIDKYHNAILLRNNELRNEITNLIEEYLNLIANSIRDFKDVDKNFSTNPFWKYINEMLINYYTKPNRDNTIDYLYNHLLRPMQIELVNEEYDQKFKEAELITQLGKKITTRRFYLRHQTISIKLQYRQFHNEISNLLTDFNRFSNNLIAHK